VNTVKDLIKMFSSVSASTSIQAVAKQAGAEVEAIEVRLAEAEKLLRKLDNFCTSNDCYFCDGYFNEGHMDDCPMAAFLATK
jgi:hypothetical protein